MSLPGGEPITAARFARLVDAAREGTVLSDTGVNQAMLDALIAIQEAAPKPPQPLIDAAWTAFAEA